MHTDVTTSYMGIRLRSPLIVGASPMTRQPEMVRDLTIAGAGAVVLPSLLEEQIVRDMILHGDHPSFEEKQVEASGSPLLEDVYNGGIQAYLRGIDTLKKCTGIPIIASLNGCAHGCWIGFASQLEAAGADGIELSIQTDLSDPTLESQSVERALLASVQKVCDSVSIPVAVKLLPFFTSLPNLAARLGEAGAAAVVLFGREPVWDVYDGALAATSHWSLSDAGQLQTTLSGLIRVRSGARELSVAASGGIATAKDVIHAVIAGADVGMVTSEIYRTGPDVVAHILEGITQYLERQGMRAFDEFVQNCRSGKRTAAARKNRVQPMLDTQHYRDPHPDAFPQTSEPWGHIYPAQVDD